MENETGQELADGECRVCRLSCTCGLVLVRAVTHARAGTYTNTFFYIENWKEQLFSTNEGRNS